MSTIGQNYSADATGVASPSDTSATSAAAATASSIAALNASPTCIVLDAPYKVGDLAPNDAYPHVYITTMYLNGPALSMSVTYEFGTMNGGWQRAPFVAAQIVQVNGADLVPFFASKYDDKGSPYLWDQVEELIYRQIQAANPRCAGTIETVNATVPTATP